MRHLGSSCLIALTAMLAGCELDLNNGGSSPAPMSHGDEADLAETAEPEAGVVETTQVEVDGFNIVRAMCSKLVAPERVVLRDAKSYCAILLDDNNRRTLARLHFNSPTARYLGLFSGKDEERRSVSGPVDIYQHADAILARVQELEGA